jgi:hypothetical protein
MARSPFRHDLPFKALLMDNDGQEKLAARSA